jgi:rhodanese-related sulfurtransferase
MLRFIFYIVIFFILFTVIRRALAPSKNRSGGKVIDMPPPPERPKVDTAAFTGKTNQMDHEITAEQFRKLRDENADVKLLDVREPWEYQTARIDGATHIPMGDVKSRAHQELDPEQHIVVVCHHGVRSMNVTAWLRQEGFEKAQSLAGGIDRWAREIDPSIPKY